MKPSLFLEWTAMLDKPLRRLPGAIENIFGSPSRFCTFSFDVSVGQQLSCELERQPNSTRRTNKMRFMVIVKCSEEPENQAPDPQPFAHVEKLSVELLEDGVS